MATVFSSLRSEYGIVADDCGEKARPRVAPKAHAGAGLPCLNGHKSTVLLDGDGADGTPSLTKSAAKTVFCLSREVAVLAKSYPINRIGFLTLTFADNVVDRKEAWKRFRSLRSHVLSPRYVRCICVSERQRRGAWHFHLVVVTKSILGTATDAWWAERSAWANCSDTLRAEWKFWREIAPKYGFGRTEMLPVKSTTEAVGHYVGKYVESNIMNRRSEDKGVRRVSYINFKGSRTFRPNFAWNSPGARRWRYAVAQFAMENCCVDTKQMTRKFGSRWCYKFRGILLGYAERRSK